MSLNIDQLAESLGCSADDYKTMLAPFLKESHDEMEVIGIYLGGDEYGEAGMNADVIAMNAGHLNLSTVAGAAQALSAAASAKDKGACDAAATALKTQLSEAEALL